MTEPVLTNTTDGVYLSNSREQHGNGGKHSSDELVEHCPSLAVFRSAAAIGRESLLSRKRPFVGRCCHSCSPLSREKFFNASIPSLGLRNVIYINETHTRYRGWLARRLCYVLFVQDRDVHRDMFPRNVIENVLNSSRVQKAIEETVIQRMPVESILQPDSKALSKEKRKARGVLQQMVSNISPAIIRLTGWVLLKLFNGFFWSIQIHKGQLEMVKKAASENAPLVFLPVHKSHIDYLLLTFILFCHNIKAPHIAAGNNLNLPIFSTLIRKLGGFFIRRKLDISTNGQKDILYRSVLRVYIEELLRQNQFLEIFVEGTRSRSGKPYIPRTGLLSIVVDSLCANAVSDIMVIPVGISYDRIIEGNYNSEQLGKPKKKESLWGALQGVVRMLRKNFGCVRVDFGQPFSVKEYIDVQRNRPLPAALSLEEILLPTIITDGLNFDVREPEVDMMTNIDCSDEQYRRQLISNIASHALFTASKCSAVMSTHIVACLLLYRHRQGVNLSKLVEDFFCMKEVVLAHDFDLGFSGNSEDVVMHALHLLGDCVNVRSSRRNSEFFITPATTIPALFELNYYSNGILQVFLTEAILACSLCATLKDSATDPAHVASEGTVSQERLIRTAASLSHLLSNDVTVALPCQAVHQALHDAVGKFIQYGILMVAEEDLSPSPTEETWANKYPDGLSWRSDEEDDSDYGEEQRDRYLKVSQSQEHKEFIVFLHRLLGPLLEAYFSAAVFVHSFSTPVEETEYVNTFHKYLLSRTEKKIAVFGESATFCLARSAMKTLKDLGVFKEVQRNNKTVLELSNTFLPLINRQKLLEYILHFNVL